MDESVKKYLIKKSGEKHPARIADFIQQYADYFRRQARLEAYSVERDFIAEVPPELEDFTNGY